MKRDRRGTIACAISLSACSMVVHAQAKPQPPWEAPLEAKQQVNPVRGDGRTVERGAQLFRLHCVDCHGEGGNGNGKMAQKLGYKPADLTLEKLNQQTDGEIFWKISKGREPMPAWDKQLSSRERWDLVSYTRTLLKPVK
jgi:mono/diheme cytochrome c family protein